MELAKIIFCIFVLISVSQTMNLQNYKRVPKLVLFDLDYTLWPYWIDTDVVAPFHYNNETHEVLDANGVYIRLYTEVPQVLHYLQTHHIPMGILSSTIATAESKVLLDYLNITKLFKVITIDPRSEDETIMTISKEHNIPLQDMILFDDEPHTHKKMEFIGVVSIQVDEGMNMTILMKGLQTFSDTIPGKKPHPLKH